MKIRFILLYVIIVLIFGCQSTPINKKNYNDKTALLNAIESVSPTIVQLSYQAEGLRDDIAQQVGKDWIIGVLGTGFLVNAEGYVITANHVIEAGVKTLNSLTASHKKMIVNIAVPPGEDVEHNNVIAGNFISKDFEVVDTDQLHDLALLKLKQSPFSEEFKKRAESIISIPNIKIQFKIDTVKFSDIRPQSGDRIAVSGYPLGQPVIVTSTGTMATSWAFDTVNIRHIHDPEWFSKTEVLHFYLADVEVNPGNSGGPIYLVDSAAVIGVCIATKIAPVRDQYGQQVIINNRKLGYSSGLSVIVPAKYVINLLQKNNVSWEGSNN